MQKCKPIGTEAQSFTLAAVRVTRNVLIFIRRFLFHHWRLFLTRRQLDHFRNASLAKWAGVSSDLQRLLKVCDDYVPPPHFTAFSLRGANEGDCVAWRGVARASKACDPKPDKNYVVYHLNLHLEAHSLFTMWNEGMSFSNRKISFHYGL